MDLKYFKNSLEKNILIDSPIVFECKDSDFIPAQYLEYIQKKMKKNIVGIDSLEDLKNNRKDIFDVGFFNDDDIKVYHTDKLDYIVNPLPANCFIITKTIDKSVKDFYKDYIVEVPKLELWQYTDMVKTMCKGVNEDKLEKFISNCNGNVFRMYFESKKINIFPEQKRDLIFDEMTNDRAFEDITNKNIFDLTNAIIKKNIPALKSLEDDQKNLDVNFFGLLKILYTNFKNILKIQTGINVTAEELEVKENQFYAIKKNTGYYSGQELMNIFMFLSNLDFKVKNGELPTNIATDYMILSIIDFGTRSE